MTSGVTLWQCQNEKAILKEVCQFKMSVLGIPLLCVYGKLAPGASFHFVIFCSFPQKAHILYALGS